MYIHIDPMHQILQLHHQICSFSSQYSFHGVVGFGWVRSVQHDFVLFIFLAKAATFKALKLRFFYLLVFVLNLNILHYIYVFDKTVSNKSVLAYAVSHTYDAFVKNMSAIFTSATPPGFGPETVFFYSWI